MEQIKIGFKTFNITDEALTNPFDGRVATFKNKRYELFRFNDEESFESFVNRYKTFKKYRIDIPKIIAKSKKNLAVVRQHFDIDNCLVKLSNNEIDEKMIEQLFMQYRIARIFKFELDYMPENYVFDGKKLYYLSKEMIKKNDKYSLENYGLFYWMYSKEGCKHLEEKGLQIPKNKLNDAETKKNAVLWTVKYW